MLSRRFRHAGQPLLCKLRVSGPILIATKNHFEFQLGGLPFLGILGGMIICLLITDRLTQLSRHVSIPFVDPPVNGTPAHAPEAGLKVVLIAW